MADVQHKTLTGEEAVHQAAYVQSTDPGAVGALKAWIDTSTTPATHKVRNATNDGWITVGGAGGVTDHGALTGLSDDDHPIYHTDARGDARYVNESDHTKAAHDALGITPGTHAHSGADIMSGTVDVARIGTGTKDATTFYRGDGTFAVPAGGGGSQATEAAAGIAEIATQTETDAGTDDTRIVTPAKLAGRGFERTANKNVGGGYPGLAATPGTPDGTKFLRDDGTWQTVAGGGATDHGALTGLGDDDHAQYFNQARGDARYVRTVNGTGPDASGNVAVSGGSASDTFAVTLFSGVPGGTQWNSMPSALTEFLATSYMRTKVDLTGKTDCRISVRMGSAGATNAVLRLQYSTDGGTTWNDAHTGTLAINAAGTPASAWLALVAGAKADVVIRVAGSGGDGATSPFFGTLVVMFR